MVSKAKFYLQVAEEKKNIPLARKPPLLVKIAPDLTDEDKKDVVDVVLKIPVST